MSCNSGPTDFQDWYSNHQTSSRADTAASPETADFYSTDLLIDKIYRSMQGPFEIKGIQIDTESDELLWITGYESEVLQAESNVELGAAFMCHNNLDYASPGKLPWKLKTNGANHRIFTLSQGQTALKLPEGFGIPVPADQPLRMISQVLNHHRPELFINTRQHVKIHYQKEKERDKEMKALYQQAVFVTKQIKGSEGAHGLPLSCLPYHKHPDSVIKAGVNHDCSIEYDEDAEYNPYEDAQGRKFTGHWVLPYEAETLATNVSRMMDLNEDSRIHLISIHLHPFAEALELWDRTNDSLLYAASFKKDSIDFGFERIDYYSSEEGIPVYKDHQYELVSAYHCTDTTDQHTAMAVMYLYLRD
jgi:hypothetical protein